MANFFLQRIANAGNPNSNTKSHKRAKVQEKEVAQRLGGKLVARSGAGDEKGDCRLKSVARIECKTTSNKSFSVTREMIDKIETAAAMTGEMPVIVIEFNDNGKKVAEVAVTPTWVLDTLRER